jgi:hypothetical protein
MIDTEGRQEDPRPTEAAARHRTREIRRRGSTRRPFAVSADLLGECARRVALGKAAYPNPVVTRSEPGAPSPDSPRIRPPIRSPPIRLYGCNRGRGRKFRSRGHLPQQPVTRAAPTVSAHLVLPAVRGWLPMHLGSGRHNSPGAPPRRSSARGGASLRWPRAELRPQGSAPSDPGSPHAHSLFGSSRAPAAPSSDTTAHAARTTI